MNCVFTKWKSCRQMPQMVLSNVNTSWEKQNGGIRNLVRSLGNLKIHKCIKKWHKCSIISKWLCTYSILFYNIWKDVFFHSFFLDSHFIAIIFATAVWKCIPRATFELIAQFKMLGASNGSRIVGCHFRNAF